VQLGSRSLETPFSFGEHIMALLQRCIGPAEIEIDGYN
jgi:hypothetical protein